MNEHKVLCSNSNCKSELGNIILIDNLEWLHMGGGIARQFNGVCANCGKEFHWSVSDKLLEKIVKNAVSHMG